MGTDSGREDTGKGTLPELHVYPPNGTACVGDMNELSLNIPGIHLQLMRSAGEGTEEGLC